MSSVNKEFTKHYGKHDHVHSDPQFRMRLNAGLVATEALELIEGVTDHSTLFAKHHPRGSRSPSPASAVAAALGSDGPAPVSTENLRPQPLAPLGGERGPATFTSGMLGGKGGGQRRASLGLPTKHAQYDFGGVHPDQHLHSPRTRRASETTPLRGFKHGHL